ncbi:serine/threonine-protein kinase [Streptomyces antnestii]|uniref:Serine/threonine-protein kinase n=1 Tax=Streptomyces antnestii TaxID=2494256 RepID=A0A3S3UBY2_9ACTN|nr:serine/threonine-protein kinase [Streptomyces sp. San01]RVU20449.1 serine/threonine-protein kinase [Streptomyces sp. San01]
MLDPLPGPPRHMGPYRLLALIGAGGMGEVYLGREDRAGAPLVAVKTVRADLDVDHDFRTRFRREIAAARAVSSGTGTAALLCGDADAGVPWLATEYVPGPALAETVARCGPLPVPTVRALGARLARALAAVHAAQLLHRDLKPGNVLLTPEGPKLIDFGIAKAWDSRATALTATGMVVGTPGFMAPEQIEGAQAVVPASDVFAFGAVLCYAATGRGPFDDPEFASVIFRITQGDADLSAVPDELRETVAACLRIAPGERPGPIELARMLDSGSEDARVPWPTEVLSLFAEHREAVARCERDTAARSFAAADTAADTATATGAGHAPVVAPPMPSTPPVPVGRRVSRRWPWLVAAAVAGAAVAVAAVVLPGGGGGSGSGAKDPAHAAPGGPRVVTAYGSADHSGEFGPAATRAAVRPTGWKPWSVPRPAALDDRGSGCVLVRPRLICRDGKGAAAAFDAATGRHRWTSRGFTAGPDDLQGVQDLPPESDGTRVFVPSELGVTAVDAATGTVRWRHRLPRYTGLLALTYAKGVVYSAEFAVSPGTRLSRSTVVRARRATDGHELWRTAPLPKPQGPLVAGDGRLYLAGEDGGVLALAAKDGARVASAPAATCFALLRHASDVLCWDLGHPGVRELDGRTLATRRTVAADVQPADPGPVVGQDGVLVVPVANEDTADPVDHFLTAYDWRTGRRLWRYGAPQETAGLALAGDRVLAFGAYALEGRNTSGDVNTLRRKDTPRTGPGTAGTALHLGQPLYLGGALFADTREHRIVSGYAP